jgi:hypothetical protein
MGKWLVPPIVIPTAIVALVVAMALYQYFVVA